MNITSKFEIEQGVYDYHHNLVRGPVNPPKTQVDRFVDSNIGNSSMMSQTGRVSATGVFNKDKPQDDELRKQAVKAEERIDVAIAFHPNKKMFYCQPRMHRKKGEFDDILKSIGAHMGTTLGKTDHDKPERLIQWKEGEPDDSDDDYDDVALYKPILKSQAKPKKLYIAFFLNKNV